MEKVKLIIDGLEITADKSMTILEAALQNEIYIPNLCYHPDLKPAAVCRLCIVDIEARGLAISCRTPVEQDLVVTTENPEISRMRRIALELLFANHDTDCTNCNKNNQCELQRLAAYIGMSEDRLERLRPMTRKLPLDTSNPFFDSDQVFLSHEF